MESIIKAEQSSEGLLSFSEKLLVDTNWKKIFDNYREHFNSVTPAFVLDIFTQFSTKDWPAEKIMICISKLSNVFYKPLLILKRKFPTDYAFLNYLIMENQKLGIVISEIKKVIKDQFDNGFKLNKRTVTQLQSFLPGLQLYKLHHLKEERLLFHVFDSLKPVYKQYLKIEVHFHHEYSQLINAISGTLKSTVPDKDLLNRLFGKLCFLTFLMVFREEYIFYPVAVDTIPEEAWDEMMKRTINAGWL